MNSLPSVFQYDYKNKRHELYLGDEFTTIDGLKGFDGILSVSVIEAFFDGSESKEKEDAVRQAKCVGDAIQCLAAVHGVFEFSCVIEGGVEFSSHDDSECHFVFPTRSMCKDFLIGALPVKLRESLWPALLGNVGSYVSIDCCQSNPRFRFYPDFDCYLNDT